MRMQAEIGDDDTRAGGQQYADPLTHFGHRGDLAAQHKGGADQPGVGQRIPVDVLKDFLVAEFFPGGDEGVENRFLNVTGIQGYAQVHPPCGCGLSRALFMFSGQTRATASP